MLGKDELGFFQSCQYAGGLGDGDGGAGTGAEAYPTGEIGVVGFGVAGGVDEIDAVGRYFIVHIDGCGLTAGGEDVGLLHHCSA